MTSQNELEKFRDRIAQLEAENSKLRELLRKSGIIYMEDLSQEYAAREQLNQGTLIRPTEVTADMANHFFSMFWGRTDVYTKRSVNQKTGKSGYYPQCDHFWRYGCPKRDGKKVRCQDCGNRKWSALDKQVILRHLIGNAEDGSDVVGIYPLLPDDTCRLIVFDFDHHEKCEEKQQQGDNDWREEVDVLRKICSRNGVNALVERSRSGNGAHVWIFFQKAIPSSLARKFGFALLRKGADSVNLKTFRYYDRLLPMQESLPPGGLGNLIALPLQGQALKEGNSAFVDEEWNAYPNQWKVLFEKTKLSREFVEQRVQEWTGAAVSGGEGQTDEKPWEITRHFHREDADGEIQIVLSDGIYIATCNLQPRLQNRIRRMAAFNNPGYFKNQAMGLSNYNNSRLIYLGRDEGDFIRIPRGLLEELKRRCEEEDIPYTITDQRCAGRNIRVEFTGTLKESQVPAVAKMLEVDCGILSAATAFGKTVVCTNLIAERKVNTLILLQSSALVEQWERAMSGFLVIDEELPEYETPTGRRKRRKSLIGRIQGSHDSSTGIIDIAMVGSLLKKGEYHPRLKEYGMVILDECHHAASDTIAGVLEEVRARYVYGVTATPMRGDGLEQINYMLLGPIRYRYSAKERADDQNIPHWVYPRFTRAVAPRFQKEKMHPNEAYALIRNNEARDELILRDVKLCIQKGRTPVVLSQYRDHSQRLYDKLTGCADSVFLLTGENSKKEHRRILQQMILVPPEKTMILIATGKLIGEGFDYPRLDTLIMATPVAGRGVVEQYAGRLNRDYEGKESVIVFDYVDIHIPMFDNMYAKRLKAYKQIGYEVCSGLEDGKQTARAIYDIDGYSRVYWQDLLDARREIIISSPAIGSKKVFQMISLLRERQEAGVRVIIVTWAPDSYGYGDSATWMELQEHMRLAGFEMNLTEEHCERFAIVDQEIVWYGSMNLLAKEDVEDNLMRVRSKEVAAELMELTFGKNGPSAMLPLEG